MKRLLAAILSISIMTPALALAQSNEGGDDQWQPGDPGAEQGPPDEPGVAQPDVAPASEAPPAMQPPPPPQQPPAPPAQATAPQPVPAYQQPMNGRWVYSPQYGWVWAPEGDAYTYYSDAEYPMTYVYYPTYGWTWVVAPWVWGVAWPYRHWAWRPNPAWHYRPLRPYVYGPRGVVVVRSAPHRTYYPSHSFHEARPVYRGGYSTRHYGGGHSGHHR